jgi:hypothetical protein
MLPESAARAEFADRLARIRAQVASTWARTTELRQQTERLLAQTRAAGQTTPGTRRERCSCPEYARLLARLETMPVIEQAKGIVMARHRCGEAEAFDIIRRASQQSNVPVRDLAAQLVAGVSD